MTIQIGTTAINLLLFLRGTAYSGASILTGYSANTNQRPNCGRLNLKADDAAPGKLAWGDNSGVTLNNASDVINPGDSFIFETGNEKNGVGLDKWLIAEAGSTKIHVSIQYD